MASVAVFLALGGGAYAALRLPKNSVGSKQIKAGAVNSSKVADGSLLAGDFKAGQLPAGAKGAQGAPCLASDPSCRGPKGDTGPQGPGAVSIDGQVDLGQSFNRNFEGVLLSIACTDVQPARISVQAGDNAESFFGWGTQASDATLSRATVETGATAPFAPFRMTVVGNNSAELDVVAEATPGGATVKWTRFDVLVVRGGKCNYHALVTPPS